MLHNVLQWFAAIKGNPLVWAQATHFLIGYAVLLTCYREGLRKRYWFVGVLVFLGAFLIEVFYDPKYEHDPFFWGGALDLTAYLSGALVGIATDYGWAVLRDRDWMRRVAQRLPR